MLRTLLASLLLMIVGCGPLFIPMTLRLDAKDQHEVDRMWDNMLTPVNRIDRTTLLDTTVALWMYTFGVDRLYMRSEKYFSGGTVMMEIDCDRANPDVDQYTITVLARNGRTLRKERYSRADVEESERMLSGSPRVRPRLNVEFISPATQPSTQAAAEPATCPATTQPQTPEERKYQLESARRQAAVVAATQPARVGSSTSDHESQSR